MKQMRKIKRGMDSDFALEVFDKAPYVTVAFLRPDNTPYSVPLSLVRTDDSTFYFHCAPEGEKLDCIAHSPNVALSAVTQCRPIMTPDGHSFTLQYRSAMAVGTAEIVAEEDEKILALKAICNRFLPSHMDEFEAAVARSLARTTIVRIRLSEPPIGKRKEYDQNGLEKPGNLIRHE